MPSLSPTMTSGTIVKWAKKEGEEVNPGDVLAEIQTDKAVVALETEEEGIMAKILVGENDGEIKVGKLIAIMVEPDEDWQNVEIPKETDPPAKPAAAPAPPPPPPTMPAPPPTTAPTAAPPAAQEKYKPSHLIGPSVRMLLDEYGLKPTQVKPTGPHDVLMKSDVMKHIKSHNLQPKPLKEEKPVKKPAAAPQAAVATPPPLGVEPAGEFEDIELTNMRKVIAKRLTQSKQSAPHAYMTVGVRMNAAMKLRKELKADGHRITVNDFIVKASAAALRAVPAVNSQWQPNGHVVVQPMVDVSVAVATPAGLITPIVHNADIIGLSEISEKTRELAGRAREGKLELHEFQGGTFTVSNLGMMGITEFTAIINPPQAAILAIGGSVPKLRSIEDKTFDQIMHVTLCFDNRIVSESDAARWLGIFAENLETPELLMSIDSHSPFAEDPDVERLAQLL